MKNIPLLVLIATLSLMSASFLAIVGDPVKQPMSGEVYEYSTIFLIIAMMLGIAFLGFLSGKSDSN